MTDFCCLQTVGENQFMNYLQYHMDRRFDVAVYCFSVGYGTDYKNDDNRGTHVERSGKMSSQAV